MPTLDEIFAQSQPTQQPNQSNGQTSLDDIFTQSQNPQAQASQEAVQPQQEDTSFMDSVSNAVPLFTTLPMVGNAISSVAGKAVDLGGQLLDTAPGRAVKTAFEYLGKPADVVAGVTNYANQSANQYLKDNPDVVDSLNQLQEQTGGPGVQTYDIPAPDPNGIVSAAKNAWDNGASYQSSMDKNWVENNPTKASLADLGLKIAADPLWVATPENIVKALKGTAEVTGLAKPISNIASGIADTMPFKSAKALGQDILGTRRIEPELATLKSALATDSVDATDNLGAAIKQLKAQYGDDAARALSDVIEADKRIVPSISQEETLQKFIDGSLPKAIADGLINKETAAQTLLQAGEKKLPSYLSSATKVSPSITDEQVVQKFIDGTLPQSIATEEIGRKAAAKILKQVGEKTVPDYLYPLNNAGNYVYRDQVLSRIPNENLRNSISQLAEMASQKFIEESKNLQKAGLLTDETLAKYANGTHLRRSFAQFDTPEKFLETLRVVGTPKEMIAAEKAIKSSELMKGISGAQKINVNDFTNRLILSPQTLERMGVIRDPEYLVLDTLRRSSQNLRKSEFLDNVGKGWAIDAATAVKRNKNLPPRRQYYPIPKTSENGINVYGSLAGKWIPKDIMDLVHGTIQTRNPTGMIGKWQQAVSSWKGLKLINPASISRNFISGIPMTNVFGEVPITSMPRHMARVLNEYKKGMTSPFFKELRNTGVLENAWNRQELSNIVGDRRGVAKKVLEKGMDIFSKPDEFWRAVTYSYHRSNGASIKEAAKMANKTQLDYSSAPEWINQLSRNGVIPFAKFPFLAGKETASALYKRPAEVSKYYKASSLDPQRKDREKLMPEYMKDNILIPAGKGSIQMANGKQMPVTNNIDATYLLPFANGISFGNPLLELRQIANTNRNSLGMDVIRPGMSGKDKAIAYAKQALGAFGPSAPLPIPGNYAWDKLQSAATGTPDYKGRIYSLPSAVANSFLGVKNSPVNDDEMMQRQLSKYTQSKQANAIEMSRIAKDQSIPAADKKARINEYVEQQKNLIKNIREVTDAYKRLKQQK